VSETVPPEVTDEALRRAVKWILQAVQALAPTRKSAMSFKVRRALDKNGWAILSEDPGTIMVETNKRHMLFGDREGPWWNQNVNHVERTHFMEHGAEAALDKAADAFADAWAEGVVARSPYLDLKR
jgi:hypothetical protein